MSSDDARRPAVVVLVMVVFFVMSLFTNAMGPLLPEIIRAFDLSLTAGGLLPFALFAAYGLASIPAGMWIERTSNKRVMVGSFLLALLAALSFAILPRYGVAIGSLFAMGVAMAGLQVAANPLLRQAGGDEQFAFFSTLAQLVFGIGSFLTPRFYTFLVERRITSTLPWIALYWLFAAVAAVMMVVLAIAKLPAAPQHEDEKPGSVATHRDLLVNQGIARYFVGVFMYVGSEQGVASWTSQFLSTYHGIDPRTDGANAVSWFWGLMTVGCVIGLGLLRVFDRRKVLVAHSTLALILLGIGLFVPDAHVASLAFPAIGLVASVMWPIIVSLAMSSVRTNHGTVSGILCTGIIGGALVPLVVGRIGDRVGLRGGMCLLFLTFAYVLGVGFFKGSSSSPAPPEETRAAS